VFELEVAFMLHNKLRSYFWLNILFAGLFLLQATSLAGLQAADDPYIDAQTRKVLTDLVETAMLYDIYNNRCRGSIASMQTDNAEKLIIDRFGLTVSQVVRRIIKQEPDALKIEIEQRLVNQIRELGGCRAAKQKGYLDKLSDRYRELFDQLRQML